MRKRALDYIVHYSRGAPFRSITSLPAVELKTVISELNEKNAWGLKRFSDANYLRQRTEIEHKIRTKFIEKGGNPVLLNPVYFFLGRHVRFEEHPSNVGYAIQLAAIPRNSISFSYGDTMLSFDPENRKQAGDRYTNPLCDQLFTLDELDGLFESEFFPKKDALAVEAQLWIQPASEVVYRVDR